MGRRCAGRDAGTDRVTPIRLDEVYVRYVWALTDPMHVHTGRIGSIARNAAQGANVPRAVVATVVRKRCFSDHSQTGPTQGNGTAAEKGPMVVIRAPSLLV